MQAFSSVPFRWLWGSSLCNAGAQWMERVATAWLALEAGGGALAVGLVLAARMVPSLLFGLMAGTIADRADRRRQLLAVSVAVAVLMAGLGLWVGAGGVQLWQVVLITFLVGCAQVFDVPARQALILDTVPREAAPNGVALNAFAQRAFGAVGAFAGGALIPLLGVSSCYFAVAAVYVLGVVMVLGLRVPRDHHAVLRTHPPFRQALTDAARLIVDIPAVRTLSLAGIACEVFAFSYMTAVPVFVRDVLDAGAEGLGTLNASAAIGGTLAVVGLSVLPGRVRREPLMAGVYLMYGAAILALAATRALWIAALALVVIGACAGAFDALQQTLIQLAVPDAQRGRAVGIWVLGLGSAPFGHLEMGALAAAMGAPSALMVNGVLVLAGALTLVARAPTYRWRPVSM